MDNKEGHPSVSDATKPIAEAPVVEAPKIETPKKSENPESPTPEASQLEPVKTEVPKPETPKKETWLKKHWFFLALGLFIILLIAFVIIIIVVNNSDKPDEKTITSPADIPVVYEPIVFDVETSDGYASYLYAGDILEGSEPSIFNEAVDSQGRLIPATIVRNYNTIIEQENITDERILAILNLKKAEYLAIAGDTDATYSILALYKESELPESQKYAYYIAAYWYCVRTEREDKKDEFYSKIEDYLTTHGY